MIKLIACALISWFVILRIIDAFKERDDWKARAEKAEARLERVRAWCEGALLEQGEGEEKEEYNFALFDVAREAGFRIIPAQVLRVEVGDE